MNHQHHRQLSARKLSIKRILSALLPKKSCESSNDLSDTSTIEVNSNHHHTSDEMSSYPSFISTLNQYEQMRKDQGTSTDPMLETNHASQQSLHVNKNFFYTPLCRRYFGLTPPNPRLYNRRLRKDYIDWYMNVYLKQKCPYEWIHINGHVNDVDIHDNELEEQESTNMIFTSTIPAIQANGHKYNDTIE